MQALGNARKIEYCDRYSPHIARLWLTIYGENCSEMVPECEKPKKSPQKPQNHCFGQNDVVSAMINFFLNNYQIWHVDAGFIVNLPIIKGSTHKKANRAMPSSNHHQIG